MTKLRNPDQLDLFDNDETSQGTGPRDAALKRVMRNADPLWAPNVTKLIKENFAGQEVLAEEWRLLSEERNLYAHSDKAWGGLTNSLVRSGVITKTGRRSQSRSRRSHSREQPIWKVRGAND
jgi:hypothetical protein